MQIRNSTLRRIIREEYARMLNEEDGGKKSASDKLRAAAKVETNHITKGALSALASQVDNGKFTGTVALRDARNSLKLSSAAQKALSAD
jgi:hypothetical protein